MRAFALAAFAFATSMVEPVRAETGVTADTILIGRTTGVTGQVAGGIKEQTGALDAYFAWVNKNGGVNGRKLVLKTLDDGFDPKRAGENARQLVENDKVFALFMPRGTPHTEAVLKVAIPAGAPVIAPSTGAEIFHNPVRPLVFNVRAKYQDEVIAGVRHLATTGLTRIAVLHVNDTFGKDALQGFEKGMKEANLKPVAVLSFDRAKNDSVAAVPELIKADPQVTILIGTASAVSNVVKAMREKGSTSQFMTLSNNSSQAFVKDLGPYARGVMMSQVSPAADSMRTAIGKEFMKIAQPAGATLSYAAMEAYAAAKVLVEGLRRAGPNLTRGRFVAGLNSMRKYDLGGMSVDYSPTNHTGSTFVEMTIIGANGNFIR